jgi:hypothetical protein
MWAHDIKDVNIRATDDEGRRSRSSSGRRRSAAARTTRSSTTTANAPPRRWAGACSAVTSSARSTACGASHPTPDGRTQVRYDLADRPGDPAAGLRQASRRGPHPQHGARAEGPRRGVTDTVDRARHLRPGRHRRRRHQGARASRSTLPTAIRRRQQRPTPRGDDSLEPLIDTLVELAAALGRRRRRRASASACPGSSPVAACCAPHRTSTASPTSTWPDCCRNGSAHRSTSTTTPRAPRSPSGSSAPVAADNMVLVTLGTGIGGGLVANGAVQRGLNGFAGEFGHMVVDPDGPRCPCGRRGCWERYASGSGLAMLAREAATGRRLRRGRHAGGDPQAVRGEHVQPRRAPATRGPGGDRRVRPVGGARAVEPHQRPRPRDVRARRWPRGRAPTCTSSRSRAGSASCSTSRTCGRSRASNSPTGARSPVRSVRRCSTTSDRRSGGPAVSGGRGSWRGPRSISATRPRGRPCRLADECFSGSNAL